MVWRRGSSSSADGEHVVASSYLVFGVDGVGEALSGIQIRRLEVSHHTIRVRSVSQAAADRLLDAGMGAEAASAVRSPVTKALPCGSHIRGAAGRPHRRRCGRSASARRAMPAARRARRPVSGSLPAGTSTLPPYMRISSPPPAGLQCTPAAPAVIIAFISLEGVQHAAEAGFRIGDDRQEIIGVAFAARLNLVSPLDLIGARRKVLLMRSTTFGTESTGYSDWSGYMAAALLASPPPASLTGR